MEKADALFFASSLRCFVPALLSAITTFLLLPSLAHAGTWQLTANNPVYSCTASATGGATISLAPGTGPGQHPNGVTGGGSAGSSLTVSGTASFQWTWVSTTTPKEPAPATVILTETATASGIIFIGQGTITPAATTKYEKKDSSSGTVSLSIPVTATVTFSGTTGGGVNPLGAGATVTISSVALTPGGATPDGNGGYSILIGQQCSATLSGIPTGCTATNLMWSVSGNTVQSTSWNVNYSSGDTSATATDPVNPYTFTQMTQLAAGPSWYWDDVSAVYTVTCTATITPPTGQGTPFTIAPTQKVNVVAPTYQISEPIGTVKLNAYYLAQSGINLHAGADSDQIPGIYFKDTVTTPNTSLYGGTGYWYRVQLVSINRTEYAIGSTTAVGAPGNSVTNALDVTHLKTGGVSILYNNQIIQADGSLFDPNHNTTAENDSPGFPVLDKYQEYKVAAEKYTDYILYHPPGSNSIDVPLFSYSWSWNVDGVHIPQTPLPKSWAHYNNAPTGGTITPPTSATRQLKYPTWTAINSPDLPS